VCEALCFVLSDITWKNNFVVVEIEETVRKRIQKIRIKFDAHLTEWDSQTLECWDCTVWTINPLYVWKVKG